jgi:cyclic nucleotide gated channel
MDMGIGVLVTAVRTFADLFYLAHMILKFRIAFVAPSSRIFGRGELVRDPDQIAIRYLKNDFIIDLAAMLPIPQVTYLAHVLQCMHTFMSIQMHWLNIEIP